MYIVCKWVCNWRVISSVFRYHVAFFSQMPMCSCNDQPVREQVNYIIASYNGAHLSSLQLFTYIYTTFNRNSFIQYRNSFILFFFFLNFFQRVMLVHHILVVRDTPPYFECCVYCYFMSFMVYCSRLVFFFSCVAGWLAVTGLLTCAYMWAPFSIEKYLIFVQCGDCWRRYWRTILLQH